MTPDKIALLIVHAAGNKLRGKTLLQKRAYFLSKILDLDLTYNPHYYGPYSPDIEEGLARTKALGYVEERTLGFGVTDNVGFEVRRYDYALTEDGETIVKDLKKLYPKESRRIIECLKRLTEAGDTGDHVSLSIAAKTHYILKKTNSAMTADDIRKAATRLGWNITNESVEKAVSFLKELRLAKAA
ncbi:MAG: hypothetical protein HY801_11595 [Candidatus Lindowbacteria bacterium]|nr:hypothetical protein [Candidatus Lindowbacteria bacterium]